MPDAARILVACVAASRFSSTLRLDADPLEGCLRAAPAFFGAPALSLSMTDRTNSLISKSTIPLAIPASSAIERAMPGVRDSHAAQAQALLSASNFEPGVELYVILALAPSRTHVLRVEFDPRFDASIRRLDNLLWAIPLGPVIEGALDPSDEKPEPLQALLGPERTESLGIVKIVEESALQGFRPQGSAPDPSGDNGVDRGPGDGPSTPGPRAPGLPALLPISGAPPVGDPPSPSDVLKEGGLYIACNVLWLLGLRLKQVAADTNPVRKPRRLMFLAFDLLTSHEFLYVVQGYATKADLMSAVKLELNKRFGIDGALWEAGLEPEFDEIVDELVPVDAAHEWILHVQLTVGFYCKKRFEGAAPVAWETTFKDAISKYYSELDCRDAFRDVFALFERAIQLFAPSPPPASTELGLNLPYDLLTFGLGLLEMGIGESDPVHAILNCEPNGFLFFTITEFFLMLKEWGGTSLSTAWIETAILSEIYYVEAYQFAGGEMKPIDYEFHAGPIPGRGAMDRLIALHDEVFGTGSPSMSLVERHTQTLEQAVGPYVAPAPKA